jgi:diacylglycerol kinase (ATP)
MVMAIQAQPRYSHPRRPKGQRRRSLSWWSGPDLTCVAEVMGRSLPIVPPGETTRLPHCVNGHRPAMTSVAVVTNKKKVTDDVRDAVRSALADAGFGGAKWYEAPKGSAATPATEEALKDGADVVLAVGGDGTVRACSHALAGTDATLAVMPSGTANLFASALGLPTDPAEVVDLVVGGTTRVLDMGRCNDLRFNVMSGTGFDAAMMEAVDDGPKDRFGTLAYVWAGVREARRREPCDVKVVVDGRAFYRGPSTGVLVGNLGKLKAGVFAFPDASPTDGKLDVGVLSAHSLKDWASVAGHVVTRRPQTSPHVQMTQGECIEVTWAPKGSDKQKKRAAKTPFELDGGAKGNTRKLQFVCEPHALRVLVPTPE